MNQHGLPCRRCGQVTGDVVTVYGPTAAGALVPRAAECRGRCDRETPGRLAGGSRTVTATARRPGRCPACGFDIIPGDITALAAGVTYHYECSPPEDPQPQRPERARTRAR